MSLLVWYADKSKREESFPWQPFSFCLDGKCCIGNQWHSWLLIRSLVLVGSAHLYGSLVHVAAQEVETSTNRSGERSISSWQWQWLSRLLFIPSLQCLSTWRKRMGFAIKHVDWMRESGPAVDVWASFCRIHHWSVCGCFLSRWYIGCWLRSRTAFLVERSMFHAISGFSIADKC